MRSTVCLSFLLIALLILAACKRNENTEETIIPETITEDYCCDHLIMATIWFQKTAEARACYYQSYYLAKLSVKENLKHKETEKKAAVVLDIDETILDNSPFEGKCIETGKSYTTENWNSWTEKSAATALPGALDFITFLQENDIEAVYISNRKINELDATIKNMQELGFPFADKEHIFLRTEEGSKVNRRNTVSENYEIILFIGDNLTDFSEIYESDVNVSRTEIVDQNKSDFGSKYIILPNPMYGEWEKKMYNNDFSLSEEQKDSLRKSIIKSH